MISRRHRRDTGHDRRFLELDVFVSSTAMGALVFLQDRLGVVRLRVIEGWGLEGREAALIEGGVPRGRARDGGWRDRKRKGRFGWAVGGCSTRDGEGELGFGGAEHAGGGGGGSGGVKVVELRCG